MKHEELIINQQLLKAAIDNYERMLRDPEYITDKGRRHMLRQEQEKMIRMLGVASMYGTTVALGNVINDTGITLSQAVDKLALPDMNVEEFKEDVETELQLQAIEGNLQGHEDSFKSMLDSIRHKRTRTEKMYELLKRRVVHHLVNNNRQRACVMAEKFFKKRPLYVKEILGINIHNLYQEAKKEAEDAWDKLPVDQRARFEHKGIHRTDYSASNLAPIFERKKNSMFHKIVNIIKEEEGIDEIPNARSYTVLYNNDVAGFTVPITMKYKMRRFSLSEGYDGVKYTINSTIKHLLDRTLEDFKVSNLDDGNIRLHYITELRNTLEGYGIEFINIDIGGNIWQ